MGKKTSRLLGHVMAEMTDMCGVGHDTWLTRVTNIEMLLNINSTTRFTLFSGGKIMKSLNSKYDVLH